MLISIILIFVFILTALFYYNAVKPMNYWKKRGVIQSDPVWLLGDQWKQVFGLESIVDMFTRLYNLSPNARYCGIYQFTTPALMIRDTKLLKLITVKDFDHFMNHKPLIPDGADPLWNKNIFALKDHRWKSVRPILTPSFTSSKMKSMFIFMSDCAQNFVNYFLKERGNGDVIDVCMKDISSRFSNDVIASTTFGLQVDSFKDPDNEFYYRCKDITNFATPWRIIKMLGFATVPRLFKFFDVKFFDSESRQFFINIVKNSIKMRKEHDVDRHDMLHLLLEAKKEVEQKKKQGLDIEEITDEDITAHAMINFFAGFESISTLMTFMSYELAIHPDIQNRLREEIDEGFQQCNGKLTYEVLMKMPYLEMVISETLRKWPNFPEAHRVCTKKYVIEPEYPDENPLVIEEGTAILLPVFPIQRDPKYFPDPDRFDPERFSEDNKNARDFYCYMPFGLGPRNCIGARFANLEAKVYFAYVLHSFEIVPTAKTVIPVKLSNQNFNVHAEDGINVGLKPLYK
ncbi:cytochrome P450 9e2-like [Diorhabda carinulata]|uniref:cytochrome P450 9e2-like n=1 Tax=Diorhabda carinulata TaxID=1163345 RepID=UPI0025A0AF42|nr:cytochrome P450 9e2-like [Diorhabda carinulata]XP_057666060.1 cytochrome P450 9e2-like [Diorhabda carinulata]